MPAHSTRVQPNRNRRQLWSEKGFIFSPKQSLQPMRHKSGQLIAPQNKRHYAKLVGKGYQPVTLYGHEGKLYLKHVEGAQARILLAKGSLHEKILTAQGKQGIVALRRAARTGYV